MYLDGLGDGTTIRQRKDKNRGKETQRDGEGKTEKIIRVSSLSAVMTDMCELLDSGSLDRKSVAQVVWRERGGGYYLHHHHHTNRAFTHRPDILRNAREEADSPPRPRSMLQPFRF